MNMERQRTTKARNTTVDITKKKNIYCSHCEFCDYSFVHNCRKHDEKTNYWKRCKDFKWRHEYICRIFREARIAGRKNAYCPYQQEDGSCYCQNCSERIKGGE